MVGPAIVVILPLLLNSSTIASVSSFGKLSSLPISYRSIVVNSRFDNGIILLRIGHEHETLL